MKRYELKYSVSHLTAEEVVAQLMTHPASFTELYPDRRVNNYYFDSSAFHCFHQNVEGHPRRKKMRLRWYGNQSLPTTSSTLEIKQKDKEIGWKNNFPIQASITDQASLMEAVSAVGMYSTDLQAVLHNTYLRSYYISADGLFRVTVDRRQTFGVPFGAVPIEPYEGLPVIVELKFDATHMDRSKSITDYLPYRQSKNSKYVNGLVAGYDL